MDFVSPFERTALREFERSGRLDRRQRHLEREPLSVVNA